MKGSRFPGEGAANGRNLAPVFHCSLCPRSERERGRERERKGGKEGEKSASPLHHGISLSLLCFVSFHRKATTKPGAGIRDHEQPPASLHHLIHVLALTLEVRADVSHALLLSNPSPFLLRRSPDCLLLLMSRFTHFTTKVR